MNYITVKLTEDQAWQLVRCLEQDNHRMGGYKQSLKPLPKKREAELQEAISFNIRLQNKIVASVS